MKITKIAVLFRKKIILNYIIKIFYNIKIFDGGWSFVQKLLFLELI